MPTYRNDHASIAYLIKDTAGVMQTVAPGGTIETYEIQSGSGLTLTAATPYYNPVLDLQTLTFTTAEAKEVTLSAATIAAADGIFVWKVSGADVSVYLNAADNTPAAGVLRPGDQFSIIPLGRVNKIVCVSTGAGSCEVVIRTSNRAHKSA